MYIVFHSQNRSKCFPHPKSNSTHSTWDDIKSMILYLVLALTLFSCNSSLEFCTQQPQSTLLYIFLFWCTTHSLFICSIFYFTNSSIAYFSYFPKYTSSIRLLTNLSFFLSFFKTRTGSWCVEVWNVWKHSNKVVPPMEHQMIQIPFH